MAEHQQDLVRHAASSRDVVEHVRQVLGSRPVVGTADVAIACNVSMGLIYAWIDEGLIKAVNVGTTDRPYYRIHSQSVVTFLESRQS